jgi:hypothetical protein
MQDEEGQCLPVQNVITLKIIIRIHHLVSVFITNGYIKHLIAKFIQELL